MPDIVNIPELDPVDFNLETLQAAEELLRKEQALTLVKTTFNEYRNYRQSNIEPDWNRFEALYFGVREQKFWPNTQVPRSSIPWPLAFEHVETAYAQIYESLFSQPDWFSVEADVTGTVEDARMISDKLKYYLDHDKDQYGISAVTEVGQAIKNLLLYGNGCLALEWDAARKRPLWSFVDIRDMYWDPQARHPMIDYSRGVIRRSLMTVEQVKAWQGLPGMDVPSDNELFTLATYLNGSNDIARDNQDSLRGKQTVSGQQYTQYSPDRLIEVLSYWSTNKHIIILGGQHVLLSTENPYNFVPFVIAPCYVIPGKLTGYAIPAVIEKNQRYMEGLFNARLDEISLSLNPPKVTKSGIPFSPTGRSWHPGMNLQVNNPKEDFIVQPPVGITNTALDEIQMIQVMSERLDGVNSHVSGVPRGGNANRTATGMQQQLQGGQLKIMVLVRNIEDYMLTPALYKTVKMLEYYESGENAEVFSKPCKFKVFGSNRMLSREQIMETMPFILQYTSNGTFLQQLSTMGKTVNFEEVFRMLSDGSRTGRSYNFIRDLTPQEQQQLSQPPPEAVMQAQQKDKELQAKMQIESMKAQAGNDPRMKQMELEVEAQKAQFEMAAKQQDLEIKKQLAQMQLQQKQMELQLKAMEAQFKLQSTAQQAQLDSEIKQQQHAITLQQQATDHEIQQQQSAELHEAEKARIASSNEQDLDFTKKSNDLKLRQMQARPAGVGSKAKTQAKK